MEVWGSIKVPQFKSQIFHDWLVPLVKIERRQFKFESLKKKKLLKKKLELGWHSISKGGEILNKWRGTALSQSQPPISKKDYYERQNIGVLENPNIKLQPT